jgi:hypothetical protein
MGKAGAEVPHRRTLWGAHHLRAPWVAAASPRLNRARWASEATTCGVSHAAE